MDLVGGAVSRGFSRGLKAVPRSDTRFCTIEMPILDPARQHESYTFHEAVHLNAESAVLEVPGGVNAGERLRHCLHRRSIATGKWIGLRHVQKLHAVPVDGHERPG